MPRPAIVIGPYAPGPMSQHGDPSRDERLEACTRRILVPLLQGDWQQAHAIVDQVAREAAEEQHTVADVRRIALAATTLETRLVELLERRLGLVYLGDLADVTADRLLDTRGCSRGSLDRLNQLLAGYGLPCLVLDGQPSTAESAKSGGRHSRQTATMKRAARVLATPGRL